MVTVGVREFKQKASQLIRMARETGGEVRVTNHGKVVAYLIPVTESHSKEAIERSWSKLDTLAAEISIHWPKGVSATEAISEVRR
jgi:prevent-host-death family protein